MRFTLEIELGNEGMRTYDHVADVLYAVRQNLQGICDEMTRDFQLIRDINGNAVGKWTVTD